MKKKSLFALFFSSGRAPWFTAWAARMMALSRAWRKISVRATVSIRPERIRSENTFPGPTEGSWSGSPTITSRQSGFSAARRAAIRGRSTMLISSTMTASASRGSFSFFWKVSSPVSSRQTIPRHRWMVWASRWHSSPSRLAARPVGARRRMFSPIRSSMATMARTEVVLPVPGPPVRRRTPWRAAISTARRWAGA